MSYKELIKNFNNVRDYLREFYVYGFKSRDEFTQKSARSYDDERRRLDSWLGNYMKFRQEANKKNVFISIDSRASRHNPLYRAWKTMSFTDGDITLHFILLDILNNSEKSLKLDDIIKEIDEYYLSAFEEPRIFDESTVRKKLNEYIKEGIIVAKKSGKAMVYSRAKMIDLPKADVIDFYSEVAPCGVIGSFILDKLDMPEGHFAFKHHYITSAMDSDILCELFAAMREKRSVIIKCINRKKSKTRETNVVPLKIMISVQNGRQYLMAYNPRLKRITSFRIDNIVSVRSEEVCNRFDELREAFIGMLPHIWGVSTQSRSGERMEHVEFTIKYKDNEPYIPRRLEREKRCGRIEYLDNNTCRFSADVYDASELIPWIRTFICRITSISFSNKRLESQFMDDIEQMYALYGLKGSDGNDF